MVISKIRKIILSASLALVVGVSAAASACTIETAHPVARITFEFNSETYEVDYTLYRNMYPVTVRHFIELADEGFYDNMVIHDYGTNDWMTGGYEYNSEEYTTLSENAGLMSEYFENNSKENEYLDLFNNGKLKSSVYSNVGYETDKDGNIIYDENGQPSELVDEKYALPTVMGEFANNIDQEIENGAPSASIGCLKMFYYEKETTQKVLVTPTSDQIIRADYKSNCATSIFSVQIGSGSSYSAANYTVFAKAGDTSRLEEFIDAVKEYFSDTYGTGYDTLSTTVRVDGTESFSKEVKDKNIETKFAAPKTPIIVKSVKITKR